MPKREDAKDKIAQLLHNWNRPSYKNWWYDATSDDRAIATAKAEAILRIVDAAYGDVGEP